MKAPAFDYVRPRDLGEALAALLGDHAMPKVLAGGPSLLPVLNLRLTRPTLLIDIARIEALRDRRSGNAYANRRGCHPC